MLSGVEDKKERRFFETYKPCHYKLAEDREITANSVVLGSQSAGRVAPRGVYLAVFDEVEQAIATSLSLNGGASYRDLLAINAEAEYRLYLDAFCDEILAQFCLDWSGREVLTYVWSPEVTPFANTKTFRVFGGTRLRPKSLSRRRGGALHRGDVPDRKSVV